MKRLIKKGMALVVLVIGLMTLLTPMTSAHAESRDHHPLTTQGHPSRTYTQTKQEWVKARQFPYKKAVYCDAGDRVISGHASLSPKKNGKIISYTRTSSGNREGGLLVFKAFKRVHYNATIKCSTKSPREPISFSDAKVGRTDSSSLLQS